MYVYKYQKVKNIYNTSIPLIPQNNQLAIWYVFSQTLKKN